MFYEEKISNLNTLKKRILLFGANGKLGKKVFEELKNNDNITIYTTSRDKKESDFNFEVNDLEKLRIIIEESQPYAIINCIAFTDVEKCEVDKGKAFLINTRFPENIIKTLGVLNLEPKVIHISTDQLYKSNCWSDIGHESPTNIYAESKLLGDRKIQEYKKGIILRTNFLWKDTEDSPISWLKAKSESLEKFILFNDVFYNPVEINFLSKLIHMIIFKEKYGTYNIGSSSSLSKAEVFKKIASLMEIDIRKASFQSINSISFKAKRPKNMTVSVKRFERDFNIFMPSIKKTLQLLIQESV